MIWIELWFCQTWYLWIDGVEWYFSRTLHWLFPSSLSPMTFFSRWMGGGDLYVLRRSNQWMMWDDRCIWPQALPRQLLWKDNHGPFRDSCSPLKDSCDCLLLGLFVPCTMLVVHLWSVCFSSTHHVGYSHLVRALPC